MSEQIEAVWQQLRREALEQAQVEGRLLAFLNSMVLDQASLGAAMANLLGDKLECSRTGVPLLAPILEEAYHSDTALLEALVIDLQAVLDRDSACSSYLVPFLYFKGFHALQIYRQAHRLWGQGKSMLALLLQSLCSEIMGVDIHPAARLGKAIMLDHATGVVIGETAVVGDEVSIMQQVTLGGTGKQQGDRHPKIGHGVLISAGAKVLGNIRVGDGAKIAASSVVLRDVPEHVTVAGIPAKPVGHPHSDVPALDMDHRLDES